MKRFTVLTMIFITLTLLISVPAMAISDESFSIGVGIGNPYGGGWIGGNLNYIVTDYVELSVGVGLLPEAIGFNTGVKVYLLPPDNNFRLRASAYYGTNAIVFTFWETITYNGLTAGLGWKYSFGSSRRHAFAFDVLYIISSPEYEAAGYTLDNRLKIAGGYIIHLYQ